MPFYTADFLADERVASMTLAERGLYVTLLCHAWREGSIPCEVAAIAKLVKSPLGEVKRSWGTVASCFTLVGDRLVQKRMEAVRAEVSARTERLSEAGRKAAGRRWKGDDQGDTAAMRSHSMPAMRFDANQNQSQRDTDTPVPSVPPYPRSAKKNGARTPWAIPPLPADLPVAFPRDVDGLRPIAAAFLDAFGNARSADSTEKHRPAFVDSLATLRSRGVSVADAWQAFGDARLAHEGKPLFGAQAKTALSYLPHRNGAAASVASGPYDGTPHTSRPEERR